ncbi:MAG: hypothetical protein HZC54_12505 [Verrucomicrobia bacterium]|nr:hypothetical protein [Verrucomicrobiota bacterium]
MRPCLLLIASALCPLLTIAGNSDDPWPGLVYVQFHSAALSRPASSGVDAQVNLDTGSTINGYSRLWLGAVQVPAGGELTFSAEADNGCRLTVGGKLLIDDRSSAVREGRLMVWQGELLPLRLEFFQNGGTAHMRLYWSWAGHARELIPANAFHHSAADASVIAKIMASSKSTKPPHTPTPTGPLPNRARIYGTPEAADVLRRSAGPIVLQTGPQLFIDDYLIESSQNLTRVVQQPARDPGIPNPVVTGPEDRCFQPFFSVLRDPQSGRFRIWYGARCDDKSASASHIAYMESEDGIHWKRPARLLDDPAPIQFGSEVLDEGPSFPDPAKRYKYGWWHGGGLRVAGSADGLHFKPLAPGIVLAHDHDINNLWRDPLRKRYVATISSSRELPQFKGTRRTTLQAVSNDLIHWSTAWIALAADDRYDKDITQFYAMSGFLARGELVIGLVKVLHDDWKAEGAPAGAFGVGYTALAWSRDGEHWARDREVFFAPDPKPGAWDHAHAWMDEQLPVRDEVYLYYGGYKWGHKHNRFEERQIGLVKMRRDRYVAREAGAEAGSLRTPPLVFRASALTINANVTGELKLRLLDAFGRPLPGFDWVSVRGDRLDHAVKFQRPLNSLAGSPVRLEFELQRAQLFGFDLRPE